MGSPFLFVASAIHFSLRPSVTSQGLPALHAPQIWYDRWVVTLPTVEYSLKGRNPAWLRLPPVMYVTFPGTV